MEARLKEIYETPSDPGSLGGVNRLLQSAKEKGLKVSKGTVNKYLQSNRSYTLHKPIHRHFSRNPTIVGGIDRQWQADLVDMQSLSRSNRGVKFILTVIDCFSKFAWAAPLLNKTGPEIVKAFEQIFDRSGRTPAKLQTDKGKEFMNKNFLSFLAERGVTHFTTQNETKAAIAERFNRTLKNKMWTYFTNNGTKHYLDVLQDLISSYNRSTHRSIRMRPADVRKEHEQTIFQTLYAKRLAKTSSPKRDLTKGPYVRISKVKKAFEKGFMPNWSDEIFQVVDTIEQPHKSLTTLRDLGAPSEVVSGRFYPEEIQHVTFDPDSPQPIEKIVRSRNRNGIKESLVKWLNYPSSSNSWVRDEDIKDI